MVVQHIGIGKLSKRNTSIQNRINVYKVNVTMTQNRSVFASAISPNLCSDYVFTSYSKDKREKEAKF